MGSGKMIHSALELVQLYKRNPLPEIINFHYLPKLYIGINTTNKLFKQVSKLWNKLLLEITIFEYL